MRPLIAVPATALLIYRAWSRQSLTPLGILAATATAIAHALHDWSVFYALLVAFFLAGTAVTKVKHSHKATLTHTSSGGTNPSASTPRTATQVFANSLVASTLTLIHALYTSDQHARLSTPTCLPNPFTPRSTSPSPFRVGDLLVFGILANYASVAADTFSSELGILSPSQPFLITSLPSSILSLRPPRRVPPGTNGGVTPLGLLAGVGGAALMGVVAVVGLPFCGSWTAQERGLVAVGMTVSGAGGSVLDSVLGAWLQASVVDGRTGKVVEAEGGGKVMVSREERVRIGRGKGGMEGERVGHPVGGGGRVVLTGRDVLSNNGVNFVMALAMSLGAMGLMWVWLGMSERMR